MKTPAATDSKIKKPTGAKTKSRFRSPWAIAVVTLTLIAGVGIVIFGATRGAAPETETAAPYVGGDLHVLTVAQGKLYVGGHGGGAVSTDGGSSWTQLSSLDGADPMGAVATGESMFIGGHPGLYRSDDGTSFTKLTGEGGLSDVHALGGAGNTLYAGAAEGLMLSTDGGESWTLSNSKVSGAFMGVILVDPQDPQRLIAPSMSAGLVLSTDGGATSERLGGPTAAMAAAWDPTNTQRIIAVGMAESAISDDAGKSWKPLEVPAGTSAATFSEDGKTLYAAVLEGTNAKVYASTDQGGTWTALG